LIIGLVSYFTWREREPLLPWLGNHLGLILSTELVFVGLLLFWAFVRSMNPEQSTTEKPMEMAFFSSARRSDSFPPADPWMSGFAISYYHFGYIILSMFANQAGTSTGLAFGIAGPFLAALAGVGVYGIVWDLVVAKLGRIRVGAYAAGLLAVVMLLFMGNLSTFFIELPYQTRALPDAYFQFMDQKERNPADAGACPPSGTMPGACPWWWFTMTRTIRDRQLSGQPEEIISEYPAFSFILADIHPHVLSLPFVLLALGLLLNLVLVGRGAHPWEFLIYVVCIGGLIFLNSWDAVFLGLLVGAEALRRLIRNGTGWLSSDDWLRLVGFGVAVIGTTAVLYLPFFVSFRSQAGGIVPNVIFTTKFQQYLMMFGTFAFILTGYVLIERNRAGRRFNGKLARQILIYGGVILGVLVVASVLIAWLQPDIRYTVFNIVDEAGGLASVLPAVLGRRIQGLPLVLFLGLIIYLVLGRLFARGARRDPAPGAPTRAEDPPALERAITYDGVSGFVLLLIGAGAVLTLLPEFAYLRDNFSTRINMIFKMYYQTWALWTVAGAFALWSILNEVAHVTIRPPVRAALASISVLLILCGVYYTPNAIYSRNVVDGGQAAGLTRLTLDGSLALTGSQDDQQAIQCLSNLVTDKSKTLVEAMKEVAYDSRYGRVAALSGIPTVLGWPNHERQWRGPTYPAAAGTRLDDIGRLYNTTDWAEAQKIIAKYGIDYIFVGSTERRDYGADGGLAKFDPMTTVCRFGNTAVYPTAGIGTTAALPQSAGG
jgi:YYY domain-containing protein